MLAGRQVRVLTFGCKVNQVESAYLAEVVQAGGASLAAGDNADLVVVNTCAVTSRSEQQARQAIRQWARRQPSLGLIVTGCYAQRKPEEVAALPGVRAVLGNAAKAAWPELLPSLVAATAPLLVVPPPPAGRELSPLPLTGFPGHTRAFVKIQDGCEHYCSYCVVPLVRGPERSLPPAEVLAQIRRFLAAGYRELVLTGINLGRYGRGLPTGVNLTALLRQLQQAGLPGRYRLSSLEPQEVTPELLATLAAWPNFCPHFHLPLQSAAPAVLAAMGRDYQPAWLEELILELHRRFPEAAVGLDVLVGFPTETAADFAQTLDFVSRLPVAYLHVFSYSPRPGTPAARLPRLASAAEVKERARRLRELGQRKRQQFARQWLQQELEVLVEGPAPGYPGWLRGLSANYLRVLVPATVTRPGEWLRVRVGELRGELLLGQPLAT